MSVHSLGVGLLKGAFNTVIAVLIFLNVVSLIGGGVWLLVLWEWPTLLYGVGLIILMPWAYFIATAPTIPLIGLMGRQAERSKFGSVVVLASVNLVYTLMVIGAWSVFAFVQMTQSIGENTQWPYLLWAYAVIIAPLHYMVQREPESEQLSGSQAGLFLAQVSFLLLVIYRFIGSHWAHFVIPMAGVGLVLILLIVVPMAIRIKVQPRLSEVDTWDSL